MKKKNKECIQSYETRVEKLQRFLHTIYPRLNVDISPLVDPVGIAGVAKDMEVLLVTTETLIGGKMVEDKRKENSLNNS